MGRDKGYARLLAAAYAGVVAVALLSTACIGMGELGKWVYPLAFLFFLCPASSFVLALLLGRSDLPGPVVVLLAPAAYVLNVAALFAFRSYVEQLHILPFAVHVFATLLPALLGMGTGFAMRAWRQRHALQGDSAEGGRPSGLAAAFASVQPTGDAQPATDRGIRLKGVGRRAQSLCVPAVCYLVHVLGALTAFVGVRVVGGMDAMGLMMGYAYGFVPLASLACGAALGASKCWLLLRLAFPLVSFGLVLLILQRLGQWQFFAAISLLPAIAGLVCGLAARFAIRRARGGHAS
jgi:hypothetical protein